MESEETTKGKLNFHYIKSNAYRLVAIDGAYGGITPKGKIFAAVYTERVPIPQTVSYEVIGDNLGEEIVEERTGKRGLVREVEIGMMLDLPTAQAFHVWLGEKIESLQAAIDRSAREEPK